VSVANTYPGLIQLETVVAEVSDPAGVPLNQGVVTFQVNGQTIIAPVINGFATVTFATPLLDFALLFDLFLPHGLTASFSDSRNSFGPSGAGMNVAGILVDFFFHMLALQTQELVQF